MLTRRLFATAALAGFTAMTGIPGAMTTAFAQATERV